VPKASLGTLVFAAVFLDAVWPVLVLFGIERFRIVAGSHSLLMAAVWAVLFAIVYQTVKGDHAGATWVGIAVASHWVLDCVTHRPDLPLYPGGGERLGLALWQSWPATFAVEGSIFAAAIVLYLRTTRSRDRVGTIAWWALIGLLVALYVPAPWSPPPPSENTVAIMGLIALAIFVPWAYWIDRHREVGAVKT